MDARKVGRNVAQSDPVNVMEFFKSWNVDAFEAVCPRQTPSEDQKFRNIVEKMGVDESVVRELAFVCNSQNLMTGTEPKTTKRLLNMKAVPSGVELESVNQQMKSRRERENNQSLKETVSKRVKYTLTDEFTFVRPEESVNLKFVPLHTRVSVPNVILSVQISKCLTSYMPVSKVRPCETFYVLGTQMLSELKDAINCPYEQIIAGDFSALPDVDPDKLARAKDIYKSGFFYIENVFYNDLRHPDNKDYSKPIREWVATNWPDQETQVADMAKVRFLDLTIRLGCYYLFTHQGNCEHSVLFQDLRLFGRDDIQDISLYPLRIAERMKSRKLCQGCSKISANWVVFDSSIIPTDPCFLCKLCFKTFLYTKNGKKVGEFKAHHYAEYCI